MENKTDHLKRKQNKKKPYCKQTHICLGGEVILVTLQQPQVQHQSGDAKTMVTKLPIYFFL